MTARLTRHFRSIARADDDAARLLAASIDLLVEVAIGAGPIQGGMVASICAPARKRRGDYPNKETNRCLTNARCYDLQERDALAMVAADLHAGEEEKLRARGRVEAQGRARAAQEV